MTMVNPFPQPPSNFKIEIVSLPAKTVLHRVHPQRFGSVQFNDSGTGNARFSPIYENKSKIIPTIYAAASVNAALMERAQMRSIEKNKEEFKTPLGKRYTSFPFKNKIQE